MTTTLALRLNAIASTAHVQRHDGLHLTALATTTHPNNAGPYYYLVTQRATSHVAFRTRRGLQRWLVERGLVVDLAAIPEQRDAAIGAAIVGRYYTASHVCERGQFDQLYGYETYKLDNARWTRAVITQDESGDHVVNFMNVNYKRWEDDDYQQRTQSMDSEETLVPTERYVTSQIVAALIPDVDGWHMRVDNHVGAWTWTKPSVDVELNAPLWWQNDDVIAFGIIDAHGEYLTLDALPHAGELPVVGGTVAIVAYNPIADLVAQRYLQIVGPVLQHVEQHHRDLTASRPMYDADSMADGIAKLVAEIDDFEFPAVRRVEAFDVAGVRSRDAGFVVTMTDGSSFVVTVRPR